MEGVSSYAPDPAQRSTAPISKRDAIINVAANSFAKQGFHGVSMRDIAKANDSSVATLYNHFTSKDAILLAIADRYFGVFEPLLEEASNQPTDGHTRLVDMVRLSIVEGLRYRPEFVSLSQDKRHIRLSPELAPLVEAYRRCMKIWYRVFTEGMKDGSVRSDLNPSTTIWIALYAITAVIDDNLHVNEAVDGDVESPLPTICGLFSGGLRPPVRRD